MNDEQLENYLRELPEPALPEAWRGPVLAAARREARASSQARATWPVVLIYLRRLFAQNPVTAGVLTTLWVLIFLLKVSTPIDPDADRYLAHVDSRQPLHFISLADEIRLAELWQDEQQPPPMP